MSDLIDSAVKTGIGALRDVLSHWQSGKGGSLIEFTSSARVEPLVVVDAAAVNADWLTQILQSLLSQFCGYYLQAFQLSVNIDRVNIGKHLDMLNPNRDLRDAARVGGRSAAGHFGLSNEAFYDKLPDVGDTISLEVMDAEEQKLEHMWKKFSFELARAKDQDERAAQQLELKAEELNRNFHQNRERLGFERAMNETRNELEKAALALKIKDFDLKSTAFEGTLGRDTVSTLKEKSDMSVGKMITVSISDGPNKAEIPINVRLMANTTSSDNLVHILSAGSQDNTAKERFHRWRSGELKFWKDLVLCNDLIEQHRKNVMKDKDGLYSAMSNAKSKNKIATIISGTPSVGAASNMVIMTDRTAAQLELAINGKLDRYDVRNKIFEQTNLMILVVVETDWERVKFYYKGIATPLDVSIRDLKASNGNGGPDVSDVLKAYQLGHHPTL